MRDILRGSSQETNLSAELLADDVVDFYPRLEADGDFFNHTPNPVVDREPVEVREFPQGTTTLEIVTMTNGRHYEVVSGEARKKRTDVKVVDGTALGTSIHGHNFYRLLRVMGRGFDSTLIGPEGGQAKYLEALKDPMQFVRNLASISIWETAGNVHAILNAIDGAPPDERKPVAKLGESRDAAIALAFSARAEEFGRQVIYTDGVAPCFPQAKPLTVSPELLSRAGEIFGQLGSLGKHAVKSHFRHPRRAVHQLRTINPDPYFLLHVAATVPTLVSGQTGELVEQIDRDAHMYLTHFISDPWAEPPEWVEKFADHESVEHDMRPGDHGDVAKAEIQDARIQRVGSLGDELVLHGDDIEMINWETVYSGGQLAIAAAA